MSEGPSVGDILIGVFIILFGLCIAFVGGGCTVMLVASLGGGGWGAGAGGGALALLLVSLAVLALGVFLIWTGFKMMTGRYRQ
jgi:hypothetical protein